MVAKKRKKLKKLVLKVNPLEETKPKRRAKPIKVLVKKVKPTISPSPKIKLTKKAKPKKPNLVKPPVYKTRIKVIGIGGGGSSIVSEIASEVKKVVFAVANTDFQALQRAAKETKRFQFGKSLTHGLGTGMNPELGEQAAESEKDKIKEILKETDFCVLISCLGGGTGSGASPVFAKILKNLRISTLGIFTLPFEFEGEKRAQIAKDSLEKLKPNLNALVIIPNQKIFQIIDKNTPLKEALSTINKALIENLEGLITLIYSSGLIRVDFADLKTILAGRGRLAYLNTVEAKNPNQIDPHTKRGQGVSGAQINEVSPRYGVGVEEVAKRVLSNPLSPYSVQGAKEVLFNIDGGLNLSTSQVEQIGKTISNSISSQARVAFGITQNKKEGIKITLLANGCQWEKWAEKKEKPEKEVKEKPKKKAQEKTEEKLPEFPKVQQPEITKISTEKSKRVKIQVKNALEMKESIEKEEKKMLAQERKWETPAFLRRKPSQFEEKSKAQ